MVNQEEWQSAGSQRIDDVDPSDQANGAEDLNNGMASVSASLSVTRRLTEIIAEDGDGDLLLQGSDREDVVLQWIRALDMQVMGACRVDERLKPMLKLSTTADVAEDPLIAQLSQHFEPAEVGILARCLCVPLVSFRVGKIDKEGTHLFPTATRKMKDLLIKKPSLAELSGISGSRLKCFAAHFRAYLTGSMLASAEASGVLSAAHSDDSSEIHFPPSSSNCQHASQGSRTNLIYQGSLLPRFSSCKEKGLSSGRSGARENLKRHESDVPGDEELPILADSIDPSGSGYCQKNKPSEANGTSSFALVKFLNAIGESPELPHLDQEKLVPSSGPSFSSHYCWCPPVGPAAQYTPQVPISGSDSFILPPLSSLLSSARPSILMSSKPLLNLADIPSMDFPSLPSESLVRLPGTQQIPTFTPLMCDPIIHIPVIDASGQGYLFSAGPTISPLNTGIIDPLLPSSESLVEKSARETLRMLISSSSNLEENVVVGGWRGLYSGTQDVNTSMGVVVLSEAGGMNRSFDDSCDSKENESSCGPWISDERVDENR